LVDRKEVGFACTNGQGIQSKQVWIEIDVVAVIERSMASSSRVEQDVAPGQVEAVDQAADLGGTG
jgi:hypothetical protein